LDGVDLDLEYGDGAFVVDFIDKLQGKQDTSKHSVEAKLLIPFVISQNPSEGICQQRYKLRVQDNDGASRNPQ
jgi:hypothetical protein